MAFTSDPLVTLVSDGLVRLSNNPASEVPFGLAEAGEGTISLAEHTVGGDVVLPAAFKPRTYVNGVGDEVALQDSVQVELTSVGFDGVLNVPVMVVKTGTDPDDFLITLTNTSAAEGVGGSELEIYIRFH